MYRYDDVYYNIMTLKCELVVFSYWVLKLRSTINAKWTVSIDKENGNIVLKENLQF